MISKLTPAMMKTPTLLFTLILLFFTGATIQAQSDASTSKPKDMYEVGVNGGALYVAGEIDPEFGYAYGLHIRKATDYLFSLRLDLMMGTANGLGRDGDNFSEFETNYASGTLLGVFSLNNVRLDRPKKKVNIYAMVGGGVNSFESTFKLAAQSAPRFGMVEHELAPHAAFGAGLSFRLSNRINVGVEHQSQSLFGTRTDKLDGVSIENNGQRSVFSDVLHFTSLQMNFNLGNPASRSEPLYWGSLGDGIMASIDDVKKRQDTALADTDQDGVIDAIDQEPNTPADVPVDTKGRTLDSDKDGIPDYKDLEPYYPPRAGERVNEDGVVINPIAGPGGGVTEQRVQEMIDEALAQYGLSEPKNNVAEWFLPMIHFGTDNYIVKYSDYGTLASIGRMLKANPDMRLVITGFTDKTGPEAYNTSLSYQRAEAVAKHLMNQHGIGRSRLVLQYKGQQDALVPATASYMNRRVEFRVAGPDDVEMDRPANLKPDGSDGY